MLILHAYIYDCVHTFSETGCPCGSFTFEGSCYMISDAMLFSGEEAGHYCTSMGFHLADVGSAEENGILKWLVETYASQRELSILQGWGQVQLTKYSSTPSTPNIYQVQVLVKYSFF